jgi:glycosyltransferase involved in cell wall biosynthesis
MRPLFSIVMANYNGAAFLAEAIESVLSQSEADRELILIDGGSTDSSLEIIKRYESQISFWLSERDSGQSEALNKGFRHAKGKFFLWLNSDDLLLPESLSAAKRELDHRPATLWIAGNTIFIGQDRSVIRCSRGPRWSTFVYSHAPLTVFGPSSIFARRLFEEVGGIDLSLKYVMDTDLWLKFLNRGYKYTQIGRYMWAFRIHEHSKTSHAFNAPPVGAFKAEQELLRDRHNLRYTELGYCLQACQKLISGVYIAAAMDTLRMRGKDLSDVVKNNY